MPGRDLKPTDSRGWSTSGRYNAAYCARWSYPLRQSARWNDKESADLVAGMLAGESIRDLAKHHQRTENGLRVHLERLVEAAKKNAPEGAWKNGLLLLEATSSI